MVPDIPDRAELLQEGGAVALYGSARVILGIAKIEVSLPVSAGETSKSSGESVHQPRKMVEVRGAKNGELTFICGLGGHLTIIKDGSGLRVGLPIPRIVRYSF